MGICLRLMLTSLLVCVRRYEDALTLWRELVLTALLVCARRYKDALMLWRELMLTALLVCMRRYKDAMTLGKELMLTALLVCALLVCARRYEDALMLWRELGQGVKKEGGRNGEAETVEFLRRCSDWGLVQRYSEWLLAADSQSPQRTACDLICFLESDAI